MNDSRSEADELRRRIRAADPSHQAPAGEPWVSELLEATMSTTPVPPASRSRRWAPAVAAVAALVALAGGYALISDNGDESQERAQTAIRLTLPGEGGTSIGSCMVFDQKVLRDMPVAFSGTATEVGDDTVSLTVDHWYKGGSADVVELDHYDANNVSIAGFAFEQNDRYLITATDGTVNFCGYSGAWTADLAAAFDSAFSQ